MQLKLLIFLMVFFIPLKTFAAQSWKDLYLISWCSIYNMDGKEIQVFPGEMCLFGEDGSIYSATEDSLRMFDYKNQVKWEIKGNFHHQMNFSLDKKNILVMGSKIIPAKDYVVYEDELLIVSQEGKILNRQLASNLFKQVNEEPLYWPRTLFIQDESLPVKEFSHLNSFYEISDKVNKKAAKFLEDGKYIVGGLNSGVFILSKDLSKVIYHTKIKHSQNNWVHDVQVMSNGNFLYFNNNVSDKTSSGPYSAIQAINPITGKKTFEFSTVPKEFFFSLWCGSVQELDSDLILFTDVLTGTFIYSRERKKLVSTLRDVHRRYGRSVPVLQAKAVDLTSFFSHRKN